MCLLMEWIVLKQDPGSFEAYSIFGPIVADDPRQACDDLARGHAGIRSFYGAQPGYIAQGPGRYFAIPLDDWQDGAFDFTKTRGTQAAFSGS
jgi:hypothetical protein